ncbi:hypothetical protein LCGC14_1188270 [marine sediment metagenome]|uniref:Uncharacterized protein n=1 Tax=marine sediment metagenome TaxID=412755 RepID=A0A0F9P2W9_9ZZZZ
MSSFCNNRRRREKTRLENRIMKQIAWEEVRDRIRAEMEELIRDGLDPAIILIGEMRKYGHMF